MSSQLSFYIPLNISYDEALEAVVKALSAEGFGILTRIDVKATLKEKIGVEFRPYTILGACNPPLAHRALSSDPETGMLLPCNVTVETSEAGGSIIRIVNPQTLLSIGSLSEDPELAAVAKEAHTRLERVAQTLKQT
ncbi:MAG TPA: DUF302 domain-containing protein [Anaerolineales bacterium]